MARLCPFASRSAQKFQNAPNVIDFALQAFLQRQQRRSSKDDCRLGLELETGTQRQRAQQKPALVERAPGYAELPAFEIGDALDRRLGWHHHGPERAQIRVVDEPVAQRPLARHPGPIRHDDVGRAGAQRNLAGLGTCELDRLDIQLGLLVEAVRLDDVELPGQRPGFLRHQANAIGRHGAGGDERQRGSECRAETAEHSDLTQITGRVARASATGNAACCSIRSVIGRYRFLQGFGRSGGQP